METKPFALSVKVIVRGPDGRCLLLRRSSASKGNPGKWEFPGGKLDPGESFDAGLLREVIEETRLSAVDVQLTRAVGVAQSEVGDRRVVYLFMEAIAGSSDVELSEEHDAYDWVPVSDLQTRDLAPQYQDIARQYARSCAGTG